MALNVKQFFANNIIDTCSIWNLLSSKILYVASLESNCSFSCTAFVIYECLYKPRSNKCDVEEELIDRLKAERQKGLFTDYHNTIADLQDIVVLESRMKLSKGELSSIVFANRTNQAILTDDQQARRLAETILPRGKVQTIPKLFAWLVYTNKLGDSEKNDINRDLNYFNRPIEKYIDEAYLIALENRLADTKIKPGN